VNYDKLIGRDDDMNAWLDAKESRTPESVLATLSYFDSLNFCGQIQCPTLMGVGLQDPICPPCTSFAAFNQITAPHEFRIYEDRGHGLSGPHYEWVIGEMLERFGPKGS
jgi:cephalosporin-C deacetylase-like acetyl esterase